MADENNGLSAEELKRADESEANNYTGGPAVAPMKPGEDQYVALNLPSLAEGEESRFIFYKHKQVQRFEIPRKNPLAEPFKFVMGICKVRLEDEREFLEACDGLHRSDSGNIVQIRHIQNEIPLSRPGDQAFRGAASTTSIKAPAVARPAGAERLGPTEATRDSAPPGTKSPGLSGLMKRG